MAGLVREMTDDTYRSELSGPEPVLVDFWAPWCGPCRAMAPVIEELAHDYQGRLTVAKVNVDDNPLLVTKFGIRGIPTLGLFRGGELVDQVVGAVPKAQLVSAIAKALQQPAVVALECR